MIYFVAFSVSNFRAPHLLLNEIRLVSLVVKSCVQHVSFHPAYKQSSLILRSLLTKHPHLLGLLALVVLRRIPS